MTKQIIQFIVFVIPFIIVSCDGNDIDVTPPFMDVISFNPNPEEKEICGTPDPTVFTLTGGDQLNFDVIFNDDDALSQYKIDIHNNFDCHGHGGGSAPSVAVPNVDNQTEDWNLQEIQNIEGQSAAVIRSLDVPQNVTTGNYHFQIQVVDVSGNDNATSNVFSLKISNPLDVIAPQISVNQPANSFSIKKGESVRFVGQVTDDRSLSDGGNGVLYLAYTDLSSGNTFISDQVFIFDENVDKTFDYDFEYTIPQTLVAGSYRFSMGANDGVRNVADFQFFEVEVED